MTEITRETLDTMPGMSTAVVTAVVITKICNFYEEQLEQQNAT